MRHGKAIEDFINACHSTARTMGYRQTELDKLHKVLGQATPDLGLNPALQPMQTVVSV